MAKVLGLRWKQEAGDKARKEGQGQICKVLQKSCYDLSASGELSMVWKKGNDLTSVLWKDDCGNKGH